jgi:endonuclease/exonuclease/phosphatase (EEP) superfamily protein YafD
MLLLEVFSLQLLYVLTLVVLTALVLVTLASHFGQYLYLELTTHFRLQYVLAAIVCAVVFTMFQSWKFIPIAIICAVLNAAYLWPYRSTSRPDPTERSRLRILHANVLNKNTNYTTLFEEINNSKPDILVLQELSQAWADQIRTLQQEYPFFEIAPRPDGAGMAILSRYPFENVETLTLDASTHLAILARVNLGEKAVSVLGLHPPTPMSPLKFKNRNRQFREAARVLNSLEGPKVLIGDLNTTMWSPYFSSLLRDSKLRDVRLGFGLHTSWPMPMPWFLRLPIDHCLVSDELRVDRLRIGDSIGSDHYPLIVDLTM